VITLRSKPTDKLIELGGGDNPQIRPNLDCRPGPNVDIVADLHDKLPLADQEYDGVFSHFALEHVSWRKVPALISEVLRILKPGGKFVCVVPNTEAQLRWIAEHPNGWDDKGPFESASCVLYGDQDYPENSHKSYFSPGIALLLFESLGFVQIKIHPYGERETDMCIEAVRPTQVTLRETAERPVLVTNNPFMEASKPHPVVVSMPRKDMFDKHYFNGGHKVGGYANEGYWDYPVHWVTFQHVMNRQPKSVLEIGCARGYLVKRFQDAGIVAHGVEISDHCYNTRACDPIHVVDICTEDLLIADRFDLALSVAVLEHVPIDHLPRVFGLLAKYTDRGLHGIDFGHKDDGFDKTHCTLRPKEWWREQFDKAGLVSHEVVDKEDLEKGQFPAQVLADDGKIKLNIGCHRLMFHHNWINLDVLDLSAFANHYHYRFGQCDIRESLYFGTNTVDAIFTSHMLEHLTYKEGEKFLQECRRVLKTGASIRIIVPDAGLLTQLVVKGDHSKGLKRFDCISDTCEAAEKLWALLCENHHSAYDLVKLTKVLNRVGFSDVRAHSVHAGDKLIVTQTIDSFPTLSLIVEARVA
jgi:predicted SAM-dependent methyltransferase